MTRATFVIKKYEGNDAYSWAVFQHDRVVPGLTGLGRQQAAYYRDQLRAAHLERQWKEHTR